MASWKAVQRPSFHPRPNKVQIQTIMRHPVRCVSHTLHRLRRFACATLLVLFPLLAWSGEPTADRSLRAAIAESLAAQGMQGAVWSTLAEDGTIVTDAAGVRDARTGAPIREQDRVHVGSIAKTVLAVAVLQLVSEGRLALHTPVSTLLPEVDIDNPWDSEHPVRIRHLLDHTAGLDDARFADLFSLHARADAPLSRFLDGRVLRVRSRPGSRHSYSNTGYTLLGMAIEAVTGMRYETHLETRLLRPLGMRDSTFAFRTEEGPNADARLAIGHLEDGLTQAAVPTHLRPAGQFTTTAEDIGRFARFLMSDGRIGDESLVDAALLRAMGRPVGTEAAQAGLRVGNGLGLVTRDRHGVVGRCHGGDGVGYRAMFCVFPESRRAFFIAINTDREGADYGRLHSALIQSLGLPRPPPLPRPSTVEDLSAWEGYYIPAPNRLASLEWVDTTLNFARVTSDGDKLRLKPFQSNAVELAPLGRGLYRAGDRTIASHATLVSADGRRVITTGTQSLERVSLAMLVALRSSLAAGVLGIVWLFVIGIVRLARRRSAWWRRSAAVPFLGIAALTLPLPLFMRQSFLALGDLTLASGTLAVVTALLPLTMIMGLILALRRRPWSLASAIDAAAMVAVLQWTVVLAWWGLLPMRLWS